MSDISSQVFQAIDILVDNKVGLLKFDKTIQAVIYSIVNLDTGEYKVRYIGNIFSAFAVDPSRAYDVDDLVFVTVPEGDFSGKKLITGPITSKSLSASSLALLQNTLFETSPDFNLLYDGILYNGDSSYGVVAGAIPGNPHYELYLYQGDEEYSGNAYHNLFQQYSANYDTIKITAEFLTLFFVEHDKGNYGLEIEFYTRGNSYVTYRLDLNSFNGDPYHFSVYSPQTIIVQTQKNFLLGVKSVKLFLENFIYDRIIENGQVTDKYNSTEPNIFVRNLTMLYVERKDLTDGNYYLTISAPNGIAFTPNVSTIELYGRLVYQGKDIMDTESCKCKWFERDLSVLVGDEIYNKDAGFGWRAVGNSSSLFTLVSTDVIYSLKYKLLVTYKDEVLLSAETEIFNLMNEYSYHIKQETKDMEIFLSIASEKELTGDWYLSYPDGTYLALDKRLNKIEVSKYLKYASTVFYCAVHDGESYLGTLEYTILNSESDLDVTIAYVGEDTFNYNALGDIMITASERERTLRAVLTWKEGYGTAYTVNWMIDGIVLTAEEYSPVDSMIEKIWVDNYNILHYNIRLKYRNYYNNNTVIIRITTITEEEYFFDKEIIFLKDGDQGTNGTTYVTAIRPCDENGNKLSGLRPLVYGDTWSNSLELRAYVYKDGELINNDNRYTVRYKWSGVNIELTGTDTLDKVIAEGQGVITPQSSSAELQFYVKVQVDINDSTNGRETSIYASYPIDVVFGGLDYTKVDIDTIPSYIKYDSAGEHAEYYNDNIMFIVDGIDYSNLITSLNTDILQITTRGNEYYLKPASSFICENLLDSSLSNIGILKCVYNEEQYLIHPVIMYLDVYGNEPINGWDGEGIKREEEGKDAYILAPRIGAGRKDDLNRFSGVVMGYDTTRRLTGLFGYKQGINSFGLMEDGTAFFGAKSGGGLIVIDGTSATIYGGGLNAAGSGRELVGGDAANGMTIYLANLNPERPETQYAIKVGGGVFGVMYDGSVRATSAHIRGEIFAKTGHIGCDDNENGGWVITQDTISSGTGTGTVGLRTIGDYRIWAGGRVGGNAYSPYATPSSRRISNPARFVVTRDGFVYMTDAYVLGSIETGEGSIGGWTIVENGIFSSDNTIGFSSNGTYRFWVGANPSGSPGDTPTFSLSKEATYFWINKDGEISALQVNARGSIYALEGEIGKWIIDKDGNIYCNGTASNTRLTADGLIDADRIKIFQADIKSLNNSNEVYGYFGLVLGSEGPGSTTYNIGIKGTDSNASVILESAKNIALNAPSGDIFFGGNSISFVGISAENQHGIYARFG